MSAAIRPEKSRALEKLLSKLSGGLLGFLGTRVRVEELDREALCAGHRGLRARTEDMGPLFPGSDTGYASRVTPKRVATLNWVVPRGNSPEVTEVTDETEKPECTNMTRKASAPLWGTSSVIHVGGSS